MTSLHIVPFEGCLEREELSKLIEIVKTEFAKDYEDFWVASTVPLSEVERYITEEKLNLDRLSKKLSDEEFEYLVDISDCGHITGFSYDSDGETIFDYLDKCNDEVLAITRLPLMRLKKHGVPIDGTARRHFGSPIPGKAIISSFHLEDVERAGERLAGVALHELGHLNGLQHHFREVDDKYCPMATSKLIREHLGYEYGSLETYDSRALKFCRVCESRNDLL